MLDKFTTIEYELDKKLLKNFRAKATIQNKN